MGVLEEAADEEVAEALEDEAGVAEEVSTNSAGASVGAAAAVEEEDETGALDWQASTAGWPSLYLSFPSRIPLHTNSLETAWPWNS